ncbi:MAG: DNA cytosine methyltransferase, partial [Pseudomonadota bacterium]
MSSATLYNDNDPKVAAWLRALIEAGHLPPGDVDARSIADFDAAALGRARTFHAFAGIGGWPYALRLAGWPDDFPVWTASLPCQPWSAAGKRLGAADPRHLAPVWLAHVDAARPDWIFGEQVAGQDGLVWLSALHPALEAMGYLVGAVDTGAAGIGAPH